MTHEFAITRGSERLNVQVQSPAPDQLAPHPLLLLNLSSDRQSSVAGGLFGEPAKLFLQHGHHVASFDLPAHGERVDQYGSGLEGLCARFVAGYDPFLQFVADGRAVIDECIRRGWGEKGRIVVCGVSRGGYFAIRLAADDDRIVAVAGLAPVTDWRNLTEFSSAKERKDVADLALDHFVKPLAGRRVYVAIGNSDRRVGSEASARFALSLLEEEARRGISQSKIRFLVVDDSAGHKLEDRWRVEGAKFLLDPTDTAARIPPRSALP
ncbi:MAG: hypothetical protein EXS38_04655 [Opitutus sp.]|nr:hypothetical protein [Opitutus sp.]